MLRPVAFAFHAAKSLTKVCSSLGMLLLMAFYFKIPDVIVHSSSLLFLFAKKTHNGNICLSHEFFYMLIT